MLDKKEVIKIFNNLGFKSIVDRRNGNIICIITANSGFKLTALKHVGGFRHAVFNKDTHGGEDVDLMYRLKKMGCEVVYMPDAIVYHEYPHKLSDIFYKFANYALGMRLHCVINNINPLDIRQPAQNFYGFIKYFIFTIFYKTVRFIYKNYKSLPLKEIIYYSFFELLRNIGHGYGYFKNEYKRKIITT